MRPIALRGPRTPKKLSMQPTLIVADLIAAALQRHGVDLIFGQSIPSSLILACEDIGIRQLVYRTENAGGAMADAYARVSGRIGVVTSQNGPAATLLVASLGEALKSSIPVLALVQEIPTSTLDRNGFQEIDHFKLFSGVTKWVRRLSSSDRVDDYMDMAITAATSGRPGPVVLLLPMDMLHAPATASEHRRIQLGNYPLDRTLPNIQSLKRAAQLLSKANNPVIVAGGGVHLSAAHDALASFQERFGIPVGTTVMGKGVVDENHPLSLGVLGNIMGHNSVGKHFQSLMNESDLVILVATRTAQNGTDSWRMISQGKTFIHIDIDGEEIGRNYESVRLAGDARETLTALATELDLLPKGPRFKKRNALEARIADARAAYQVETADVVTSDAGPVRPERVMAEVINILTTDMIVTADASYSSVWVASYLRALKPGMRFLAPRGLAGLGWGLPFALGAQCAFPTSKVLCFSGDGGFGHVWSEMETAVRERLPVILTVLNNQVLGFQKDAEDERHGRHTDACYFAPVDHAAIARAVGCLGIRVEKGSDYAKALQVALNHDGPVVIDVITDPSAFPPLTIFDDRLEKVRADRAARTSKQPSSH